MLHAQAPHELIWWPMLKLVCPVCGSIDEASGPMPEDGELIGCGGSVGNEHELVWMVEDNDASQ